MLPLRLTHPAEHAHQHLVRRVARVDPAANDAHVFITYVAVSVSHFARRTHGPVRTLYRAVTCSARRINETVGSSTHAASHASDHDWLPAEANP